MEPIKDSPPAPAAPARSNRRILIIASPKGIVESTLAPHEILYSRNMESSLEIISNSRPDLVIYFAKGHQEALEEHVMTWLIEGFRGKFLLFDPANRVKDFQTLMDSQVVDEYLCGPVSPARFASIVRSQMTQDIRFASPRAMTTFDLFRNLFDRGLNAIFFFAEDLNRCVAANLRAEQITGHTLYELRRLGLHDLCSKEEFEKTIRIIRRAGRQYYDAKGNTVFRNRLGRVKKYGFSCGVFNFGRKSFVKIEVQDRPEESLRPAAAPAVFQHDSFLKALDHSFSHSRKKSSGFSLILCKIKPKNGLEDRAEEELLEKIGSALEQCIRSSDTLARLSHYQFAILLPKTTEAKAEKLLERLRSCLLQFPEFKSNAFEYDISVAQCPPEAYPFMHLLRTAEAPTMIHLPHN